jgi:energy-coupling factor transporter ATP-binding protein EcfA2
MCRNSLNSKLFPMDLLILRRLEDEYPLIILLPLLSSIILFVLSWYCMQVFGDSDSEFKKPAFFFLSSNKTKKTTALEGDRLGQMEVQSRANHSFLIHKLSKSYNMANTAVKEFCGEFTPGMCYVLLGPNGCGKTSLIKMLSGVSAPTNGRAFLFGDSIRDNVGKLFEVSASCYQEDVLWNNLTVADHMRFFALFRNVPNACKNSVIDGMLDAVDLTYARDRLVSKLSGGMKRRLCFLLSIIGTPEVLFLDEPTTGLDPINRRKVWNLVQEHKKDKIVIL